MEAKTILLVDDEFGARVVMRDRLAAESFELLEAENGEEAVDLFRRQSPDLVLMDVNLGEGIDGFEATRQIKELAAPRFIPVILCTVREDVESKKQGLEFGADDYITKPFDLTELVVRVRSMLRIQHLTENNVKLTRLNEKLEAQHKQLQSENENLKNFLVWPDKANPIVGESQAMQSVYRLVEKVADTSETVLLTGETGVGKELVAQLIHHNSDRRDKNLLVLDCPAVPDSLFESELFGYKKGSFSGAYKDRKGVLTEGDGSTVLLDEIGELPLEIQAKLLRFFQDGTFRPIGANKPVRVNVRILAATNRNLEQMVSQGKFRQDLFYRLKVLHIHVPPLRQRREDIPLMAMCFLDQFNDKHAKKVDGFSPEALRRLEEHPFSGNVRQLKNTVIFAATLASGNEPVGAHHLEEALAHFDTSLSTQDDGAPVNLKSVTQDAERKVIRNFLNRFGQDRSRTAKALGITRQGLWKKMKKLGFFESD